MKRCSLCKSPNVNKTTCPLNREAVLVDPETHPSSKNTMHVQEPWLDLIDQGEKTIEGRVGQLGKFDDKLNKVIVFFNEDKFVPVELIDVRHYDTLEDYLLGEDWHEFAPHLDSLEEVRSAYQAVTLPDGEKVFSPERIRRLGGINALEVRRVK